MSICQIYTDGKHYDQLFPSSQKRPQFWIDQAHLHGDPILELACGTGRITVPLAEEGFEVVGVDISTPMLEEAKRKAELSNVAISFQEADMRHFNLGREFQFIFLASNALCHLLDLESFESSMVCVKRHLREDGKFVVEVFVPKLELLLQKPEERVSFAEYNDPYSGEPIVVTQTSIYDLRLCLN